MRIFLTGAAGHVGSRLSAWIKQNQPDTEIVGVDDLSCGYAENVPRGVELIRTSAYDRAVVNDCGPFDVAIHLAAYAAECMSPFVRRFNYSNNLVQTAGLVSNLIDAGFTGRLVFTSSIAVYGDGHAPFSETDYCHPHDPYGVAKRACEEDIRIAGEQHGIDWCVLRPHNIYGPYQSLWQKYRNVIGLWMRAALEGEPITIFGDGQQRRAFTYIDDILPCLWRAATEPKASKQIINLGGSTPITINELASALQEVVGILDIRHAEARHEVKDAYCTTRRSEELLGYRDRTSLKEGLSKMWGWARYAWERYPERRRQSAVPAVDDVETFVGMPERWREELACPVDSAAG